MGPGTERRKALSDESAPFLGVAVPGGRGADCTPTPTSHHPTPVLQSIRWLG